MKNKKRLSDYLKIVTFGVCLISTAVVPVFATSTRSKATEMVMPVNGGTLKSVLKYIEENSKYMFIYRSTDINLEQKINVKVDLKKQQMQEVLNTVFASTGLTYVIEGNQIIVSTKEDKKALAQQQDKGITVTGIVTDEAGIAVIGASVVVAGTTNGAITDVDGRFSLNNVDPEATINIS